MFIAPSHTRCFRTLHDIRFELRPPLSSRPHLLNLALGLEVLSCDKIWDVIIILIVLFVLTLALTLLLLHALVALGKLPQRRERIGTELVEDAGDELRQLLILAVSVDGKGVCGYGGVHYRNESVDC